MFDPTGKICLNLGCGSVIIDGFINADISKRAGVDLICDLNDLSSLQNQPWYGKVSFIYLSHVLEHFETAKIPSLLKDIHAICGEGGCVRISVPDLDKICQLYVKNIEWFKPPHNPWLGLIYGGQTDQYDFHKTGYNFAWLESLLLNAGFAHVERVDSSEDLGVFDASQSQLPFGNIALTVEASKGDFTGDWKRFEYSFLESLVASISNLLSMAFLATIHLRILLIRKRTRSKFRS